MATKPAATKKSRWRHLLRYSLGILLLPIGIIVFVSHCRFLAPATRKKAVYVLLIGYLLVILANAYDKKENFPVSLPVVAENAAMAETAAVAPDEWMLPDGTCRLNERAELFLKDSTCGWLQQVEKDADWEPVVEDWQITLKEQTYFVSGFYQTPAGDRVEFTLSVEADPLAREVTCLYAIVDGVKYRNRSLPRLEIYRQIYEERG